MAVLLRAICRPRAEGTRTVRSETLGTAAIRLVATTTASLCRQQLPQASLAAHALRNLQASE